MKKNLTVNTIALGNIRGRKKQYITLIIGIMLAMFFSGSIIFLVSCLISSNEEILKRDYGDFYGYFYNPQDYIDIEKGKNDGYIEQYGYAHFVGYAYTDEEKKDKGTPIAWLDDDAKELYYAYFDSGRYPETTGEIAVEKDALLRLGIDAEVGEKINLSVLTPDGTDYLPDAIKKTYTLVGILSDKRKNAERINGSGYSAPFAAAFVCENEEIGAGGKENIALYFKPYEKALKKTIVQEFEGHKYKSSLYSLYFTGKIYEKFKKMNVSEQVYENFLPWFGSDRGQVTETFDLSFLPFTLAAVLLLASCMGIINAFTTNLGERKKQIGMLRAVGATRRQIINIFGREAFIITLICAPVSIIFSYFAVKVFATLMGDSFVFLPNLFVLFGSVAVSVVCVMLASLIPLFSASRISPMQAIRNFELSRKQKQKNIKSKKQFSVPTLLAKRSLKFYKSKQVGVSIILTVTILLTCFGFSFINTEIKNGGWYSYNSADYVVRRSQYPESSYYVNMPEIEKGIMQNDIQSILDYPLFDSVYGSKKCISYITCDEYSDYMNLLEVGSPGNRYSNKRLDNITSQIGTNLSIEEVFDLWIEGENEYYTKLKLNSNTSQEMFMLDLKGFDSEVIKNNINKFEVIDGKINIDKLNSGEEIILVANQELGFHCTFDNDGEIHNFGVNEMNDDYIETHTDDIRTTAKLNYKAGDKINLRTLYSYNTEYNMEQDYVPENIEYKDKEVAIGAIVNEFTFDESFSFYGHLGILTTTEGMLAVTDYPFDYESLCIDINTENDDETDKAATDYLYGIFAGTSFSAWSGYGQDEENEEVFRVLLASMISVIILFFSISASIVNNALTAKIRESKREIGTLRAVGASAKELTSSYIKQFVSMFAWGCGFGFGGYIIGHLILKYCTKVFNDLTFEIWQAVIICVFLLAICSFNLYRNVKKQMKYSIVENIREL